MPSQQVAKPVPNSSCPRTSTHQDERVGDCPTLVESRLHGASGTSTTVGNTRSCTACSTGLTHAVRLTNRQGASNPRRPLAPNLPVLKVRTQPARAHAEHPWLRSHCARSHPGHHRRARRHTYLCRTAHTAFNRLCLLHAERAQTRLRRRSPTRDPLPWSRASRPECRPTRTASAASFTASSNSPGAFESGGIATAPAIGSYNFSPQH